MLIQGSMAQEFTSNLYKQTAKITEEQSEKLSELLSDYDADNLSDDDAQTIVTQVKELGITAGSELASALADAGFDAKELAEQAGIGGGDRPKGPPPPPPPPQETQGVSTVDDAVVQLIADAVEAYDVSQEEEATLGEAVLAALEEAGYDSSESPIDFYS